MVVMACSSLDISYGHLYLRSLYIRYIVIRPYVKRNRLNAVVRDESECARIGHTLGPGFLRGGVESGERNRRQRLLRQAEPARPSQTPSHDAVPSRVIGDPRRYFAAAVLRSADAQASATARLGSTCPGNVTHPLFITNSV